MASVKLTISPSSTVLEVGQTATLVAQQNNGLNVVNATWTSSNKAQAHVGRDTGLVTALAPGVVTIQATYRGSKAKSTVTVVAAQTTDLTITCPGNQTVAGTGPLTVVKLGPIQTSGGVAPIAVAFSPPVGSGFPVGTTLVTATATSADLQRAVCQYSVTVTGSFPPPPELLTLSCPPSVVVDTPDGDPVVVTFTATTTGGTAPVVVTYDPVSGSEFALGTTSVAVTASSADGQSVSCAFPVIVRSVVDSALRGPQASITCPVGAVGIATGASIQSAITANPGATVFCLAAGVHTISAGIIPKTGNTFCGAFGAILDGTGWVSSNINTGAFMAHNLSITDVTIKNLVIRNMPQKAIHAFKDSCYRWTVENCELTANKFGINAPNNSTIKNNYIHHNVGNEASSNLADHGGGYGAFQSKGTVFENNEISYNGTEQKIVEASDIVFRNNFVHHNEANGIWYDGENPGSVIEGNIVEDHAGEGIFYEVSGQGIIRNNTVRRSGASGIFLSTSKGVDIYGNILEDNYRGIQFFIDCSRVGQGTIGFDLANNYAHDNTVRLGAASGVAASVLGSVNCDAVRLLPYTNGSKNLVFQSNHYEATTTTGAWWYWNGAFKTWVQWQALGHDLVGSITVR